jgi:hypothetical protein
LSLSLAIIAGAATERGREQGIALRILERPNHRNSPLRDRYGAGPDVGGDVSCFSGSAKPGHVSGVLGSGKVADQASSRVGQTTHIVCRLLGSGVEAGLGGAAGLEVWQVFGQGQGTTGLLYIEYSTYRRVKQ